MNLYSITCSKATRFAGSKGDATKARMAMMKEFDLRRAEIAINDFEVASGKAGVLAALNAVAAGEVGTASNDGEGDE